MALVGVVTQRLALQVPEEFMRLGGTELAPMSTTTDLATAMTYVKQPPPHHLAGDNAFAN